MYFYTKKEFNDGLLLFKTKNKEWDRLLDISINGGITSMLFNQRVFTEYNCIIERIQDYSGNGYLIVKTNKNVSNNEPVLLYINQSFIA